MKRLSAVIVVLSVVSALVPVRAQTTDHLPPMTPVLALAALSWSESGLVSRIEAEDGTVTWENDEDMRAIHAVLLRGSERERVGYLSFARMYARGVVGRARPIERRWLWGLDPSGAEPIGWPSHHWRRRGDRLEREEHAPWSAFRARWLAHYAHAQEVQRLRLDTWAEWGPCEAIPDDWGGAMDRARAERLRLIPVECGPTDNDFYIRPSSAAG